MRPTKMTPLLKRVDALITHHCGDKHGRFTCFSNMTGISKSAISNWYKRGLYNLDPENIDAICSACNISIEWLLFGRDKQPTEDGIPPEGGIPLGAMGKPKRIPVLSFAQAGRLGADGIVPDDQFPLGYADEYIDSYDAHCSENAYYLRVDGKSMEPLLRQGDNVLIEPTQEPSNGSIVAAKDTESGEVIIKRYLKTAPDEVILQSENPEFIPIVLHPEGNTIIILGVATRMERGLS